MKILIAPDSFKGSLEAIDFCHVAKQAILDIDAAAEIDLMPLADGGEGSVDALLSLDNVEKISMETVDALNRNINAFYAFFETQKTAFIEMASAAGLYQLSNEERNPFTASTYGVGLMVKHAIDKGAEHIVLGLGGSCTNDGGVGFLSALGFEFYDENNKRMDANQELLANQSLANLHTVKPPKNTILDKVKIFAACDVSSPLTGKKGASYIFAEQKGAKTSELETLDANLKHYANVVHQDLNIDIDTVDGAGAAGGMGAGILVLNSVAEQAILKPGFELISDLLTLDEKLSTKNYALIITGEGVFNEQSQYGKVPVALSQQAKKYDIPVVAICGGIDVDNSDIYQHHIKAVFSICNKPLSLDSAMQNADKLLYQCVQNIYRLAK